MFLFPSLLAYQINIYQIYSFDINDFSKQLKLNGSIEEGVTER